MLSIRELEAQAKALVPVIRGYVASMFDPLSKRLDGAESRIKAIESVEPATIDEAAIVEKLISSIPEPKEGEKGADGTSVTVEDVTPIIAEQVAKAIADIELPKDGEKGERGEDGKSVPVEDVQRMVDEAVAKAVQSIELPKDGKDGKDGRDAMEIEVLPAINEERSYCKNTFASHNGGIWIARRKTHGMDGWECIVNGWASTEIITYSERGFGVSITDTAGGTTQKQLELPAMIYRGIFKAGMYAAGDTVTWGGSLWHCDEPTEDKPGEVGSKGWTLAAKRGRDGRDGRNGIDKTAAVKLP